MDASGVFGNLLTQFTRKKTVCMMHLDSGGVICEFLGFMGDSFDRLDFSA